MREKRACLNRNERLVVVILSVVMIMACTVLLVHPGYAWPFMSLEDKAAQITDEVIEGCTTTASDVVNSMGQGVMKVFCQRLSPDFSSFNTLASGINLKNILDNFTRDFGIIIAFLILFCAAYSFFFAKAEEPQDTPMGLVIHFMIAMTIIFSSVSVVEAITNDANLIWTSEIMKYRDSNMGNDGWTVFTDLIKQDGKEKLVVLGISIIVGAGINWVLSLIALLILIILFIPYIKALFRLYFEILQRYILWCIMLIFMPLAAATIVSNSTIRIWKSYVRMVVSTFIIFCAQVFLFALSVDITLSGFGDKGVVGYFLGIAFIQTAGKLDNYVARLGVSVAQTAGQLTNSMRGGLGSLVRSLSHAEMMRRNAGAALMTYGTAAGSVGAVKLGQSIQTFGASSKPLAGLSVGDQGIGDFNGNKGAYAAIGKNNPGSLNLGSEDAKNFMKDYLSSAKDSEGMDALNALSEESKLSGLNALMQDASENNSFLEGMNISDVSMDERTGALSFSGTDANGEEISGTMSDEDLAKGISFAEGSNIAFDNQLTGSVDDNRKNISRYQDDAFDGVSMTGRDSDGMQYPLNPNADKVLMKSGNAALAGKMSDNAELQGVASAVMNGDNTLLKDHNGHQIGLVTADGTYYKANRGSGPAHDSNQAFTMNRAVVEKGIGMPICTNTDSVYKQKTADGMPYRRINAHTFEVPARVIGNNGKEEQKPIQIISIGNSNGLKTVGNTVKGKTRMKGDTFKYNGHTYTARTLYTKSSEEKETKK